MCTHHRRVDRDTPALAQLATAGNELAGTSEGGLGCVGVLDLGPGAGGPARQHELLHVGVGHVHNLGRALGGCGSGGGWSPLSQESSLLRTCTCNPTQYEGTGSTGSAREIPCRTSSMGGYLLTVVESCY